MSYGVGGLLGGLDTLAPGLAMMLQPIEVGDLLGNDLIDTGATGSNNGWEWRVIGIDEFSGNPAWKVIATHQDIRTYCLGSATMELWIEEGNPWAAKQKVDVDHLQFTNEVSKIAQQPHNCSTIWCCQKAILELHHVFERTPIERGQKQLDLGAFLLVKAASQPSCRSMMHDLTSWGANGAAHAR